MCVVADPYFFSEYWTYLEKFLLENRNRAFYATGSLQDKSNLVKYNLE